MDMIPTDAAELDYSYVPPLILAASILLLISVLALPLMPHSHLPKVAPQHDTVNLEPLLKDYHQSAMDYKQQKEKRRLQRLSRTPPTLFASPLGRSASPAFRWSRAPQRLNMMWRLGITRFMPGVAEALPS